MKEFEIIGIFLPKECSIKYSKNLEKNEFYQLNHDYEVNYSLIQGIKAIESIEKIPKKTKSIFSIENLDISISAIVGKNGSGKSTILELIYLCSFLLAEKYDFIEQLHFLNKKRNPEQKMNEYLMDLAPHLTSVKEDLKFELYFNLNDKIHRIVNNGIHEIFSERQIIRKTICWKYVRNEKLSNFFYSIVTNYSHYGLNEKYSLWLIPLFHKNDGYQTPIVINPHRKNGNIDINSEHHLAQTRVLSNLEFYKSKEILKDRLLEGVNFEFSPNRTLSLGSISFKNVIELFENANKTKALSIFEQLHIEMYNTSFSYENASKSRINSELFMDSDSSYEFVSNSVNIKYAELEVHLIKYVIYKIFKICWNDQYFMKNFTRTVKVHDYKLEIIHNIDTLVQNIAKSKSHLTLKVRQMMNTIRSNFFNVEKISLLPSPNNPKQFSFQVSFNIDSYLTTKKDKFKKIKKQRTSHDALEFIPSAFANVNLFIKNSHENPDNSPFKSFSSGEQQFLLTLQTLYYHLYNLNSVEIIGNKEKYSNVCVIFDEAELYFHPEYQRKFIHEMIFGLKKMNLQSINSLNIIFSTHSPFILSDIPSSNILRLIDGKPQPIGEQTFGANIYDLLNDDFFLNNGVIGEFAKSEIKRILSKTEEITEDDLAIIELIGDPFLKGTILSKVQHKMTQRALIEKQIETLQKKIDDADNNRI